MRAGGERDWIKAVALSQVLAVCAALTGVASESLAESGFSMPYLQSLSNYVLLAIVFVPKLLKDSWEDALQPVGQPWWRPRLHHEVWKYVVLSLSDTQANFVIILAFRYTSITSVTLLDCFSTPVAMLLTWSFLRARFQSWHIAGAACCLLGILTLVLGDAREDPGTGDKPFLGDSLVLLAASLYAVTNVGMEYLLKGPGKRDPIPDTGLTTEVLGMVGALGSCWVLLLVIATEAPHLRDVPWGPILTAPLLLYAVALFAFYSLSPYVIRHLGAATYNVALLTSDLWAALARALLFGGFSMGSAVTFAVAAALVASGLVVYATGGDVYGASQYGRLDSNLRGATIETSRLYTISEESSSVTSEL